ncbi:dymeclin-like [Meleagris gallopavo]|uniref:dymeclin-like n=1 Tax=Meleagris gallopavo TaxID=9103 RepID=UPI0012AB4E0D|nr:dymeclin-like [Meleagris gallopavo]
MLLLGFFCLFVCLFLLSEPENLCYDSFSGTECEDLIEELLCCLIQLIVEIPLLDITYSISLEAVTTLIVFLSCQLFHKEILRESLIHKYLMRGRCLPYTSRLVKTLLYNFIRQERSPPPGTHVFQQQTDGGGLLYGIASGVAI